jgi:hypothetical protein
MSLSTRLLQNLRILDAFDKNFSLDLFNANNYPTKIIFNDLPDSTPNDLKLKEVFRTLRMRKENIAKIRTKYNLSPVYQNVLEFCYEVDIIPYISGGMNDKQELYPFVIKNPQNKDEDIVVLNITPETSIADIQRNWKQITLFRNAFLNITLRLESNTTILARSAKTINR